MEFHVASPEHWEAEHPLLYTLSAKLSARGLVKLFPGVWVFARLKSAEPSFDQRRPGETAGSRPL